MSMTKTNVKLLQDYLDWKAERNLIPATLSPEEYAEYLQNVENARRIEKALEMIEKYNKGIDWEPAMVDGLKDILEGKDA